MINYLSKELKKANAERDAYREAGARVVYEVQGSLYFQPLTYETCLSMLDRKARLILSERGD